MTTKAIVADHVAPAKAADKDVMVAAPLAGLKESGHAEALGKPLMAVEGHHVWRC
jgi:hypothetical protein